MTAEQGSSTPEARPLRVLILSWHGEHGAISAGGHRRTHAIIEEFRNLGEVALVDNAPAIYAADALRTYRSPSFRAISRIDRRAARVIQWALAAVAQARHGAKLARAVGADVIYVPNSDILPCIVAGVVVHKMARIPLVACNMNVENVLLAGTVARLHRAADRVIVLSPPGVHELRRRGFPGRVEVNGCGTPALDDHVRGREPLPLLWDGIFIGRQTVQKGILDLLAIWEELLRRRPQSRLALVGECAPEVERVIEARCAANPALAAAVHRLGVVAEADKHRHLDSARVLAFPSRTEGWGFVPVEALMHGVPVVCWDLPAYESSLPDHPAVKRVATGDVPGFVDALEGFLGMDDGARASIAAGADLVIPSWGEIAGREWRILEEVSRAQQV